jgi:hypothetical protein
VLRKAAPADYAKFKGALASLFSGSVRSAAAGTAHMCAVVVIIVLWTSPQLLPLILPTLTGTEGLPIHQEKNSF